MFYDTILTYLGELGPYQKRKVFLMCLMCVPHGIQTCAVVFTIFDVPFRCAVPGIANDTWAIQNEAHGLMVNASIPQDSDSGQCNVYTDYRNETIHSDSPHATNGDQTVGCSSWVYDPYHAPSSAVADWDLVCDRKSIRAHISMTVMLGQMGGSFCGGPLADYFGRKKALIGAIFLQAIFAIGLAFVTSPFQYMAVRFATTFLGMASYLTIFVMVAEIVGPRKRTLAEMGTKFGWCVGLFILALVSYFTHDWRISQLVMAIPWLAVISLCWLVDESPRWLIVNGRIEEAKVIINNIAKVNGTSMPEDLQLESSLQCESLADDRVEGQKIWHFCTSFTLVVRLLILCLGWATSSMVYYGLMLNVGTLVGGDMYVNFVFLGLQEAFGYIILIFILGRLGRKIIYCASLLLSGLACLAVAGPMFAKTDILWVNIFFLGLGKLGITGAFTMVFIVTAELLPTSVRNSGMGFCSFVGRIGGLACPYVATLGFSISKEYGSTFPLMVFGVAGVVAGLTGLLLPETKNRKLPDTIKEARHFGKSTQPVVANGAKV